MKKMLKNSLEFTFIVIIALLAVLSIFYLIDSNYNKSTLECIFCVSIILLALFKVPNTLVIVKYFKKKLKFK